MNGPSKICERTERKEERVQVRNKKTGTVGLSWGCTIEGDTVQVELSDGSLDSWPHDDCESIS